MRKLTFEYVKNYFKEQGCELLEKEYINNSTKMRYKCNCGEASEISFGEFKRGGRCMKCGIKKRTNKNRLTFKYVYNFFKEQKCELLEKTYINSRTPIRYRCECKNISKINFYDFKQGGRCFKCRGIEKHTLKYVKKYFNDNNCLLLEKIYKNSNTPMKYRCNCGNISKISFNHFKNGKRCKKCGIEKMRKKRQFSYNEVKKHFNNNNCRLLEKTYKNSNTPMKYQCNCGNISKIRFSNFKLGERCKKCGIEKNSGKNNYGYNSNITDKERLIKRNYLLYRKWRKKVYGRDKYTCQKCSQVGKYLNAHHIKNYSSNKKLRLVTSNGITFCKKCHIKFHKKYGTRNNNKQQLNEFLKINIIKKVS
jgi:5-methylcytosine-specific restriction endonuclease McrA